MELEWPIREEPRIEISPASMPESVTDMDEPAHSLPPIDNELLSLAADRTESVLPNSVPPATEETVPILELPDIDKAEPIRANDRVERELPTTVPP
jgi:hypothetical protein